MGTAIANVRPRTRTWNTLRTLKGLCGASLLLELLLVVLVTGAVSQHQAAVRTLAEDGAPGSVAALEVESALVGMDAEAARELALPPGEDGSATRAYDADRTEAVRALLGVAETLHRGGAATGEAEALEVGLGDYERLLQQARDLHQHRDQTAALGTYSQAAQLMETRLLPEARSLASDRTALMETTFDAQGRRSGADRWVLLLVLSLALLALGAAQVFLSRRTHRTFNLLLLAATLGTGVLGVHFFRVLGAEQEALVAARQGSFDNLSRVLGIRFRAHLAYQHEGQALLPGFSGAAGAAGRLPADEAAVASLPPTLTAVQLVNAAREGRPIDGFTGPLADELQSATAPGEREAAVNALAAWEHFVAVAHSALRAPGLSGGAAGALPAALGQLDRSLDTVQQMDQAALAEAMQQAGSGVRALQAEAWVLCALLDALVAFGFAPRIREYL